MFKVVWSSQALGELRAMLQIASHPLRRQITAAVQELDRRLKSDPATEGESRPQGSRITFEDLLGIRFRVNPRT